MRSKSLMFLKFLICFTTESSLIGVRKTSDIHAARSDVAEHGCHVNYCGSVFGTPRRNEDPSVSAALFRK